MSKLRRILAVDDEARNLSLLQAILDTEGYETESAKSGFEAVDKLDSTIDLVLLDILMPGMDGFEVIRRIRDGKDCRDVPIIVVTALDGRDDRIRATELGANDFISKPIDRIELTVRIAAQMRIRDAQDALTQSEHQYRTITENANVGIFTTSLDGIILQANPTAAKMAGYESVEEFLSIRSENLYLHPEERELLIKDLLVHGSVKEREILARKLDGSAHWVSLNAVIQRDPSDNPVGIVGIVEDVTERKRAEEELRQYRERLEDLVRDRTKELEKRTQELETANIRLQEADRLKSVFLASMSHEFRTPLNSIIGFTGIMLMGMTGELSEEQKKQLSMVKSSANHLLGLVEDVLEIAKIEAGRAAPSLGQFELGEVVDSAIEIVSPMAEKKGLELVREVPAGIMVVSDKRRMRQILMNIVGNAVKFTEHGNVKISARISGDENLELRFTDTGIGIREQDMNKLFSPFQQIDDSLTKAHEGTGLGLYLCKKLAILLGGDIEVTSTYGKGSEFTVVLPLTYGEANEKDSDR